MAPRAKLTHDLAGLRELQTQLRRRGEVVGVAIERGEGLLVESGCDRAADPRPARTHGDVADGLVSTDMATRYQHVTDEILPLAEDGLLTYDRSDEIDVASLTAALADLRTALFEPDDNTSGDIK